MSRVLAHRLTKLEQQVQARNAPRWPAVDAAVKRLRSHAVATLKAILYGQDPPARDETQAHADSTMQIHGSVSPLTAHQPWAGTWWDRRRGRLVGGMLTTRPDHA
jgi:hypothetical protein